MAQHEIPVEFLYESDHCFVIRDIHPKAAVHLLVIPKVHLVTFNDITADNAHVVAALGTAIGQVTSQLNIATTGYRVIANNGEDGGQEVNHLHLHILGGERLGKMI
jgi:histidine triad (HIT) family protein